MNNKHSSIDKLSNYFAKFPGIGPRSARRMTLFALKKGAVFINDMANNLNEVASKIIVCDNCGNIDEISPCGICNDERRSQSTICVIEDVSDLWAMERSGIYKGIYHILGGVISMLNGVGPQDLSVDKLISRIQDNNNVEEVIIATNATVDGKTTSHYVSQRLKHLGVTISEIAHGVPIGGELDYLDEGTLSAAFKERRHLVNQSDSNKIFS